VEKIFAVMKRVFAGGLRFLVVFVVVDRGEFVVISW
jgi:hypothetical protein